MPSSLPGLMVVATPLGNPGDMSPRAREALETADLILAEDTRRAGLLCQRLGVKCPKMQSFHEHNEERKLQAVLERLRQGECLALMTDAGTPLMADPGYHLVRACRQEGLPVTPVPGASAAVTALMASGLPPYPYTFLGFPPRKSGERRALFAAFARLRSTLVVFERKDRAWAALEDARQELGAREFCIARELTKTHEEFIFGNLESLDEQDSLQEKQELRGEITVCIGPPLRSDDVTGSNEEQVLACIEEERLQGGAPKEIARRVAKLCSGWSVKEVYSLMQRS